MPSNFDQNLSMGNLKKREDGMHQANTVKIQSLIKFELIQISTIVFFFLHFFFKHK